MLFDNRFPHSLINYSFYLTHKSYKMVDNKSKTSLIRRTQKNISLIKIININLMLHTRIILLSSFVIFFFFSVYVIQEVFLFYNQYFREILVLMMTNYN